MTGSGNDFTIKFSRETVSQCPDGQDPCEAIRQGRDCDTCRSLTLEIQLPAGDEGPTTAGLQDG